MAKNTWQLYNNTELVIDNKDADILFGDEEIIYIDEYGRHIINKSWKTYQRVADDNEMVIDFKNQLMIMIINGKELSCEIKANYKEENNTIVLTYEIEEEKKQIIVKKGE